MKQATLNRPFLLPLIVFAQFAGTSLWFAGNAVIDGIQKQIGSTQSFAGITAVIQFGFIAGTLLFAILTVADRFKAATVFFFASLLAALANFCIIWAEDTFSLLLLRFITGFFLAGIYPVGMKIAADCFPNKLGNALGFLVGALVLGTAFPHLLKAQLHTLPWQQIILATSLLAATGGLLIYFFVPHQKSEASKRFDPKAAIHVFRSASFRSAAFGYFGHMWELYAFWAFVPFLFNYYNSINGYTFPVSFWSFITIAIGAAGCVVGGLLSKQWGSQKVAFYALLLSALCCLCSPFLFTLHPNFFIFVLCLWGFSVVADSPQFSTLVAQSAPAQNKGTALTIVTSIGFAITIISIQLLHYAVDYLGAYSFLLLAPGPLSGLLFIKGKQKVAATMH